MNLQEIPACGMTTTASSAANHIPSASGSMGTIPSDVQPNNLGWQAEKLEVF